MYLQIGFDMSVRTSSIIGIFDMDNTTTSKRTRDFLTRAEREGQVVPYGGKDDLPISFLVTAEYGMTRIYQSDLTTQVLKSRIK